MGAVVSWLGIGLLILLVIGFVIMYLPATKGWAGERVVRRILKSLPAERYIVLNDLYFRRGKWRCQIDHLVVSEYGIFCLETKNYLGVISGDYHDKYLRRRVLGMNYKTYSPIFQNYRHLQRLVEAFSIVKANSRALHSLIVFLPGSRPRISGSGAATICMAQNLRKTILGFRTPVIPWETCVQIASALRTSSRAR